MPRGPHRGALASIRCPRMRFPAHDCFSCTALFLAVVSLSASAQGQLTYQQATAGLYQGQKISSVSVVADPRLDVAPLLQRVTLKPGEQFSDKQVQASLAALKAAGNFTSVSLNVVPGTNGLQLSFILQPAYYIGIIKFPGASKYFSYARLLQVVNLPDEDAFDKSHLPAAAEALLNFLHSEGYFQAQVQTRTALDNANQLVHVTFDVQRGKRAKMGAVQIEGPAGTEDARLLHALHSWRAFLTGATLKPGKPYTPGRIRKALALIKRSLAQQKYLASTVQQEPPQYHAESNRADISFHVETGPEVDIRITGAHLSWIPFLSGREERKLIPIFSEAAVDRDLVQEGQRNLADYFQKKGYFDVKVKVNVQHQPGKVLLTYDIQKGKRHRVTSIAFHGNRHLSDRDLQAQITVKKAHFFWQHGSISEKELQESVKNLEALYNDHGFESVTVTPQVVDRELKILLTFSVEEGTQTLIGKVQVSGNSTFSIDQLTAHKGLELRPGAPFSQHELGNDRSRIAATYLNRGFLNAEVKAKVTRDPADSQKMDVTYQISENQCVRISRPLYLGLVHTRQDLVAKTANLHPEAPMSQGDLLQSESALYDLGIFDWASVGPRKPISTQANEEVLVKAHEAQRNEITYGFGIEISHRGGNVPAGTVAVPGLPPVSIGNNRVAPSEASYVSPRGSIEFTRRNLFGRAQTGAISLLASRLDQRVLATYADPRFRGSQWQSLTSISLERTTENPLYTADLGDASFQLERLISRKKDVRAQLRYDFNKTYLSRLLVPELVLPQDRNVHLSTISGTLIEDTRDKPLDAHHGVYATLDFGLTPKALGSSVNFAKLFGQYAFYKPGHGMVWANSVRLGLSKAFAGSFVPTSQLFFSGGGTSLRGFPLNEAGPQRIVPFCNVLSGNSGCVNVTVPLGGRQLFILNSELRFPLHIMHNLGGVVFYDGGNVYQAINLRTFFNNYTNTVGIGLRYATPVGPIRIDIGRNLNPVPGIKATQYFITLGQSF